MEIFNLLKIIPGIDQANQYCSRKTNSDLSRELADLWLELGDGKSRLGRMAALIAVTPQPVVAAPNLEIQAADVAARPIVTAAQRNVNIRSGSGTGYDTSPFADSAALCWDKEILSNNASNRPT